MITVTSIATCIKEYHYGGKIHFYEGIEYNYSFNETHSTYIVSVKGRGYVSIFHSADSLTPVFSTYFKDKKEIRENKTKDLLT